MFAKAADRSGNLAMRELQRFRSARSNQTEPDEVAGEESIATVLKGVRMLVRMQKTLTESLQRVEITQADISDVLKQQHHLRSPTFQRFTSPVEPDLRGSPTKSFRPQQSGHERHGHALMAAPTYASGRLDFAMGYESKGAESSQGGGSVGNMVEDCWPRTVRLRVDIPRTDEARLSAQKNAERLSAGGRRYSRAQSSFFVEGDIKAANEGRLTSCYGWLLAFLPFDPDSSGMLAVHIISLLLLIIDISITPYLVVFNMPPTPSTYTFDVLATTWWSFDIVLGFFTGLSDAVEEQEARQEVAKQYTKTWLMPNLLPTISDWIKLAVTLAPQSSDRLFGVMQTLRILRVLRFFKLVSLILRLPPWWLCGQRQNLVAAIRVMKIMLGVLLYNHVVCCTWIFIGHHSPADTGVRWTDTVEHELVSTYSEYMTALHWTLCQMTPGPVSIVATNSVERIFNCVLLVVGLLFGGLLVSFMSGQIMQVLIRKRDKVEKVVLLDRFLRQHAIHPALAFKVQRQVRRRIAVEAPITENEVIVLKLLSSSLYSSLIHEMRKPHLVQHQLFMVLHIFEGKLFERVCESAVRFLFHPAEDELFKPSEECVKALLVIDGEVVYRQSPETSKVDQSSEIVLGKGAWMAEVALWCNWAHVGDAQTVTSTRTLTINAMRLLKVLKKGSFGQILAHYARAFHARVIHAFPPFAPWPSDIFVPFTDSGDLLPSRIASNLYRRWTTLGRFEGYTEAERLEFEAKCRSSMVALQERADGALEHVVASLRLRITADLPGEDVFFAQLGWQGVADEEPTVKMGLPGRVRVLGELPQEVLMKLLKDELAVLESQITISGSEHEAVLTHLVGEHTQTELKTTIHATMSFEAVAPLQLELRGTEAVSPFGEPEVYGVMDLIQQRVWFYSWITQGELNAMSDAEQLEQLEACLRTAVLPRFPPNMSTASSFSPLRDLSSTTQSANPGTLSYNRLDMTTLTRGESDVDTRAEQQPETAPKELPTIGKERVISSASQESLNGQASDDQESISLPSLVGRKRVHI